MFDPVEVRALLIEAARARETFTYGALLNILGHAFTRPLMRQLCKVLDRIDEDGRAVGQPGLAVLVVRQADGLPGQGWFVSRTGVYDDLPLEWEEPEARRYTEARQAEAFAYWAGHERA
ncbi:MAG: ribose-phosphate pyrophosphokinase [Porphyrobacter sp.]|nr:ribose-phosphate pyrophosphokinase [Porphyrobacter sp.]